VKKSFKIFYRHPNGGFRYINTVSIISDIKLEIGDCLEKVFYRMQGEVWSPNGEAKDLIMSLGVQHTSMSTGDIVRDNDTGNIWRVEDFGWKKIEGTAPCEMSA
jgi:hypothetical protein